MTPRVLVAIFLLATAGCASTLSDTGLSVAAAVERGGYGQPLVVEDLADGRRAFHWEMRNAMVVRSTSPAPPAAVYASAARGEPLRAGRALPECVYTLYGVWDAPSGQWKVTSFKRPHISCVG